MDEITRILRPHGILISVRSPLFRYTPEDPPSVRAFRETYDRAMRKKRSSVGAEEVDFVSKYEEIVSSEAFGEVLWQMYRQRKDEAGSKGRQGWGLKVIEERIKEVPIGTWMWSESGLILGYPPLLTVDDPAPLRSYPDSPFWMYQGRTVHQNIVGTFGAAKPVMVETGSCTQAVADQLG
jgi:hypothetical protein